jgi:hypothetical protein
MLQYNFLYPNREQFKNATRVWFPSDTKEIYEEHIKNPKFRDLIPTEYFNYEFNNYGFRCDNFTDYSKHKYRILFLGCSHTEGIGLPVEETWAYKLLQRINEELGENIPYWTIAMGGTGLDAQTRALYQLNDMLRPNIIIALFPEVCRREVYNGFHYLKHIDEKYKIKHYDSVFFDERLMLYQLGKNLSFLKLLADKYNTKIIANPISSAEIYYKEYLDCFDFYKYETDFYSCKLDNGRDLKHLGKKSNTKFALKVYDEIFPTVKQILHNQ